MTGAEIRRERLRLGMTQEALAHQAGVSWATVQKIETGKVKPHASTLKAIEAALISFR